MSTTRQEGMFDEPDRPPAKRVFHPTNRHNVLKALATRLLSPLSGYADKYYEDLLRFSPGRVPLIAQGIARQTARLLATAEFDFPVLVEVDPNKLRAAAVPAFGAPDGRSEISAGRAAAWAPAGPIPLTVMSAIHLQSESDRAALTLNEYADVRLSHDLVRVSPDLFNADVSQDGLDSWLESLMPPDEPDLELLDRRSGALLLALTVADADQASALASAVNREPEKAGHADFEGLSAWLRGTELGAEHAGAWATLQIFDEISRVDRAKVWRPLDIVDALRARLRQGMPTDAYGHLEPSLDRAAAILRDEVAFEGLKGGGSPILKSLLLVLMRPEPDSFARWDVATSEADADTRLLSFALLGAVTGRGRIPVSLRPEPLDDLMAAWTSATAAGEDSVAPPLPRVSVSPSGKFSHLIAAGREIIAVGIPDRTPETAKASPPALIPDATPGAASVEAERLLGALQRPEGRRWALEHAAEVGLASEVVTVIRAAAANSRIGVSGDGQLTVAIQGDYILESELSPDAIRAAVSSGRLSADTVNNAVLAMDREASPKAKARSSRPGGARGERRRKQVADDQGVPGNEPPTPEG